MGGRPLPGVRGASVFGEMQRGLGQNGATKCISTQYFVTLVLVFFFLVFEIDTKTTQFPWA